MTVRDRTAWLLSNSLCDVSTHCWRWQGSHKGKDPESYGTCHFEGHTREVHTVAYEVWIGPIPFDEERGRRMDIDHVYAWGCRFHDCINPAHLEAITNAENVQRAALTITHCRQNHEYTPENTYTNKRGHRFCKECRRVGDRARAQQPERQTYLATKRAKYKEERHDSA